MFSIIIKKGNYFASLNNFIPREKVRCSKVYNCIEICITHGMCVDHMARQKQVGFIYHKILKKKPRGLYFSKALFEGLIYRGKFVFQN